MNQLHKQLRLKPCGLLGGQVFSIFKYFNILEKSAFLQIIQMKMPMIPDKKQLKCRPRGKPWPPGVSGNPAGRPLGAVNKLTLAVGGIPLAVNKPAPPVFDPLKPYALCVQEGRGGCYLQDGHLFEIKHLKRCDFRRGHAHTMTKVNGIWRRTVEQDGKVYDRDSGVLIEGAAQS